MHQSTTCSEIQAYKSGISALDIRAGGRSRRASSLAPGPDTPVAATPSIDPLHGSETGRKLCWRKAAALLQAHTRRFSSSSAADRASERHHLDNSPEPENSEARLHSQRGDSSNFTALGYADLLLEPTASLQQLHGLPKGVHKHADAFVCSKRLTPQSVISASHGTSATPSESGDHSDQDHAAVALRLPQLRTSHEYAAQFGITAANLAADQPSLLRQRVLPGVQRRTPRSPKAERRVKRSLSSVQPRAWSLTSQLSHPPCQSPQDSSALGFGSSHNPSPSDPSLVARLETFQRIVPYSQPSASDSESLEGQHAPAPLPSNELARQAALDSLNVMNDPPAAALHDIAVCAASAFQVPVVVIALIGDSTVWCQVSLLSLLSCVSFV